MKIKSIHGAEPRNEGQEPYGAGVGYDGVTQIAEHLENLGTYGVLWFMVFKGDHLHMKMNAAHVAAVYYEEGAES